MPEYQIPRTRLGRLLYPLVRRVGWFFRDRPWVVIGVLWVVAYVLGCVGAAKQFAATGEQRSRCDPLYRALQLFIMDDGMVTNGLVASWELEVARFLAPAVAAYAALAALAAIFRDQVQMLRLRFFRGHVVICGLGRKGLALAIDFRRHGDRVVVIERDHDDKGISTCRQLGIIVLLGDATEKLFLQKARVAAASYIVAITGDDGTNAEIAVLAYEIVQARRNGLQRTVHCFVHVVELKLCALLARHRIFADFEDYFEARLFNIYQNSARTLFEEHPPDRGLIIADGPRTAHLVILGFGHMGESIAMQFAKAGHYASAKPSRLTVIDVEAEARRRSFYSRYPQFDQVCSAQFLERDVEDPETLEKVRAWAADSDMVATVIVALDDDGRSLSCGLNVLSRLAGCRVPLIVRMSDDAGLATLLERETGDADPLAHVHAFGVPSRACTRKMLLNEELDVLARAIHEEYVAQRGKECCANDPSTLPWEQLDPGLKDSNREQADHLRVKLRAIGCHGSREEQGKNPVTEFTDEEVEILAAMEHARWTAERALAGWRLGEKGVEDKTSPYLVPWRALPDHIRQYNRQAVRQIPKLLSLIGEKVYRGEPAAREG
jgi:voltage-gated potassium channel Kch